MITDPWNVYAQEHRLPERVDRLERQLQFSLTTHCVDHALAAILPAEQGLLGAARQALWEPELQSDAWLTRLQAYAEQVTDAPNPQDPPVRAVDALAYAYAGLDSKELFTLEALYSAFWAKAEALCLTVGWVEDLLGSPDLMEELDARIGSCWQAYQELGYQAVILGSLELRRTPLSRADVAALIDQFPFDEAAHTRFARELYRRALTNLSQGLVTTSSHLRVLLGFAAFEQDNGQYERAAELYHQALLALQTQGNAQAVSEVQIRLKRLKRG